MTYKLYRCGSKYTGDAGKLTFMGSGTDRSALIYQATIEADTLLAWAPYLSHDSEPSPESKIYYGYRNRYDEPAFAISTHNPKE